MNKGFAVIAIILLVFSALIPAIALSEQLEERGLNDTGNITMPDLLAEDITASSPLYQNETARINATIRNNGADASHFNVSFSVDSVLREEKTIEALNENENAMISFDWIPAEARNYSLKIVADSNNEINESDKSNNELELEVFVLSVLMHITIVIKDSNEKIHIQNLSLALNESILNATVIACENLNIASNSSGGDVTKIGGLHDPKLFLYNKSGVEWIEIEIDHELKDLDIIGWSAEHDLPLMLPDLTPENITITSFGGIAYPNVTNEIEVRIRNEGLVNASNFTSLFKVNDGTVDEIRIESLNRTQNKSISFNWTPNTTGDYSFTVELDPENNISESNETNNKITKNVTVRRISIIKVPTDYPTIQEAIDAAPQGGTIFIENGEYHEKIEIRDRFDLTIVGESKDAVIKKSGTKIIAIVNSRNITISNLTLIRTDQEGCCEGVMTIIKSSNCKICENSIKSLRQWYWGLRISESNNNTIYNNYISCICMNGDNNTIYNNTILSLGAYYCSFGGNNNTIYLNNIFGFGLHAGAPSGNNNWNSTSPVNYTYNGTTFTNYTGNFWYNYKGYDNNRDDIGEVPYKIGDGYDYYPLIEPHGLTFDLTITTITKPCVIYANRTNVIGAFIERSGTYPSPEEIYVNLTANSTNVSRVIAMSENEKKLIWLPWTPNETGNCSLKIAARAVKEKTETNDTNNEFSINVNVRQPLFNYTENITSALDFLNSKQLPRSGISGFSNSARAALAIIAAGEDPSCGMWKPPIEGAYSLIEYLRKEPKNSVGFLPPGSNPPCLMRVEDFARMILVISAVGEDPTDFGGVNYLVMLKSYYDGEQFGDPESAEDDALAILALVSCGEGNCTTDNMITNATNYIKAKQNEDEGWSSYGVGSDVKTTSLVIQALIAAGEDKNSDTIQKIHKALDYLKNAQEDEGGYSNVITTSYAIQTFIAAEEDLSNYNKTIDYLLSLQQPDGSFNYTANMSLFPPRMTIFPVLALCGEPYPVMIKTTTKSYELPEVSVRDIVTDEEICVNTSYVIETNISSNGGIFYADLLADEKLVERKKINSVWHDSLTPVSFSWKPNTTGDHNLTVFADSLNNITEFNETNNNATIEVNVTLPDLYPSWITPPERTYVNVTNVINCTIRGTTDEHFNVTLEEADGESVGKQRIEGIRDNFTISFEWRPSANRAYNLRFTVDSDAEVGERDDANNTLERPVDVLLPDLVPKAITVDEVFVNARNKVNVTVEGMAENFNLSLIENGTVVGKTINVTCYGKENVTVYWKPTTLGNHTIAMFVDSNDVIKETNETNNKINATFEVLLPDLVPEVIAPDVLYIDEVNAITVTVNGTAEGFNATLVADEIVDKSGPLCYLIAPIFNGTFGESETFSGTGDDSYLTYNITEQRANWSWEDIDTQDIFIASTTSSWLVDSKDTWSVDYVAVVVNYTLNSTNRTLELNASDIVSHGNWSNGNNTNISDDEYATTTGITTFQLGITDTDAVGNITSVVIKVEQHVVDAVPTKKDTTLKKTNLNTYNGSIAFEWLPMKLGEYKLTVFLDSDNDAVETNETNNNLTRSVIVANRIDLGLTSPLGGEKWNGTQNITWNASYETSLLIDIFYSPDRGYRWINITTNETNDGSYAWDTEDAIDGEYMIKIVARCGMVTAEDRSDVFFVRNTKAGMEWGSFHANAGYAPGDAPDTNEIAWQSDDIGAEGSSSLIVADGKIFAYCTGWGGMYSDYTYLVALRQRDDEDGKAGEVLWGTKIAPRVYGSWATPAYKDGSIFVSSGNGVYRIDADTGEKIWKFRFPTGGGSVNGGPAVTSRAVYVGDWDGQHYYCIENNRTKPTEIWNFSVSSYAQSVPAVAYGNVYFGSWSDAYAVDAWNGTEVWSTPSGTYGSVTVADRVVYFTRYDFDGMGTFFALDAANGTQIWSATIEPTDSTPAYYPSPCRSVRGYIYTAGGGASSSIGTSAVRCLNAKTGELIWIHLGLGSWTNSPIVTRDGKLFVGKDNTGFIPGGAGLYCLDAFTGKEIWHSDCGGSSPVVVDGFVYTIGSGMVLAFGNGTRSDLTVEADAQDGKYIAGKEGYIIATIENIGTLNVTKNFKVELRYEGEVIAEQTIEPPLNISNPKIVLFEWTPEEWSTKEKTKEYRLTVEVDPPPGNVPESGLGDNNIDNVTVIVHDNKPDLVTKIEKVSPNPAYVGDTVTVEANITNIGYETNESFWVRFNMDGVEKNVKRTSLEDNVRLLDFTWIARYNGTHNLAVEANPGDRLTITNEVTWTNNNDSIVVEVMPTPTPTPKYIGRGSGKDGIGEGPGGIGEGSGIGEAGAGEAGGMQIPVNASGSAEERKKEVFGFPFGNASSGAPGGGGTLPLLFIALIASTVALFYFGYYKEKRTHKKHFGLYRKDRR